MMKAVFLALTLLSAPFALTACETLPIPTSANRIDEQALGAVYAAGILANHAIVATAPTMTRDQALKARAFKARADSAVKAAEQAKAVGDALAYASAIREATSALNGVSATIKPEK